MTRDAGGAKRAKILDKIKKLLALSTSSNVNEAATAAAAAQRLMLEHKLTEADVSESQAGQMFELSMGAVGFASRWKFVLVTAVARSFFCEAIGLRVGQRRKVRIVGMREDVEIASQVFKYLHNEIDRLSRIEVSRAALESQAYGEPADLRQYLDSFRRGAVVAVIEKLRRGEEEFVASDSRALVLAGRDREQVREYVKARFSNPKFVDEKESPRIDDLAFVRGYELAHRSIMIPDPANGPPAGAGPGASPREPPARSPAPGLDVIIRPAARDAPAEVPSGPKRKERRQNAGAALRQTRICSLPDPEAVHVTEIISSLMAYLTSSGKKTGGIFPDLGGSHVLEGVLFQTIWKHDPFHAKDLYAAVYNDPEVCFVNIP